MSRVLITSDKHCPAVHPRYLHFCKDLRDKHKCDTIIDIGDIIDMESISFHTKHPDLPGPKDEHKLALKEIQKWYKAFPKATITIGNHDERVFRKAAATSIPASYLRDYNEIWKTPNWNWVYDIIVDGVYYHHGSGSGGLYPAFNKARNMGMSVVSGHIHAASGVWWTTSPKHRFFGMNVGSGIDVDQLTFDYGRHLVRRPVLSAAVVIDAIPTHVIMPCGPGEKYHKRKRK